MAEQSRDLEYMLWRERVANRPKHWVRAVTACNSKCLFCLDSDTPRNVYLEEAEIRREIDRGIDELGADKLILSGGEATLHPAFVDLVAYAKERGYDRVQTVTNGYRLSEKEFFERSMAAGLGEITFSIHGHNEALHDRLTGTEGAFKRIVKGIVRALRDGRPIVNVDVVINKQNVAVLDKIVELCISLGVTEFDLLHVIPQAAAFDNRDELFYDVREHLPVLHKVFKLGRHPRFVVWTNRFPVSYLEGLEDLIQDPHKMLDEVNGRRFQLRRYLDEGAALDCRHPERCPHCFIEPFCTSTDRVIEGQLVNAFQIYWVGSGPAPDVLPFGCSLLGVSAEDETALSALALPDGAGLYLRLEAAVPLAKLPARTAVLVASSAAQLELWLGDLPPGIELDIELNEETARFMLAERERLRQRLDQLRIVQPGHEHLSAATKHDIPEPRLYFEQLALPIRVSGLPACLIPGALWEPERALLPQALFDPDTGRLSITELAHFHVRDKYRAKSVRCADCVVDERCEGAHINWVRNQGLAPLTPITDAGDPRAVRLHELMPEPPPRLATGAPSHGVAASLPGFPEPEAAPPDPLMVAARERDNRRRARRGLPLI
ncbi:MAG: radical SAM protein [Polyangiaceae bacterium]